MALNYGKCCKVNIALNYGTNDLRVSETQEECKARRAKISESDRDWRLSQYTSERQTEQRFTTNMQDMNM